MIFSREQLSKIKEQALAAAANHDVAMLLDNNYCSNAAGLRHAEFIAACGVADELRAGTSYFGELEVFAKKNNNKFIFTWLGYDLKNELEQLSSVHPDGIGFTPCYAFVPKKLLVINEDGSCTEGADWALELLNAAEATAAPATPAGMVPVEMQPRVSRAQYLEDVEHIRQHIIEGDVYELNYCTEFYSEKAAIDPALVYQRLICKSPVPFGAFIKWNRHYLMCASPERFITRKGNRIYSQPIKGTAPRGISHTEDEELKRQLLESEKERAENLMIVDLVRNDLARTAQTGSVKVDELFGIYSFPQVHQMISTVSAVPQEHTSNVEVIKQAFPMGSMTGAPKIMAMRLIEQYERTKRGLYSGAVGYMAPNGDFDLNVVIRSLQYNGHTGYLNFEVGSAITYDSVPEEEYNECLLKAKAMMEVLREIR
jgi:para-aminobenzoate synthetase component I